MRRSLSDQRTRSTNRVARTVDDSAAGRILTALACDKILDVCNASVGRERGLTHCPAHDDSNPSLNVDTGDDGTVLLKCHSGCSNDDVIEALKERGLWGKDGASLPSVEQTAYPLPADAKIVATYDYTDADGALLFQVVRYLPKDFRQRAPDGKGGWINSVRDIPKVLYRLPELITAVAARQRIYVCEGEKDADNVKALGLVATTNPGGGSKWLEEYAQHFIGANVVVLQDKDGINPKTGKRAGEENSKAVAKMLEVAARTIKIVELPGAGKDVSDWIEAGGTRELLETFVDMAEEWSSGDAKAILTPKDLATQYRHVIERRKAGDEDYIGWRIGIRSLDKELVYMPGDLVLIAAATGVGKTTFLQTLERAATVPTMLFSIEQPWIQLVDRLMASVTRVDSHRIARGNFNDTEYAQILEELDRLEEREDHLLVDNPSLTTSALETLLRVARARFGVKVAFVDYAQRLADKDGESEYQRVTRISNNLTRIARVTKTCVVGAVQVNRKGARDDGSPPQLKDIRDSGYLEQDAAIVLGIGRVAGQSATKVAILKNRNGVAGITIDLEFDALHGQFIEPNSMRRMGEK